MKPAAHIVEWGAAPEQHSAVFIESARAVDYAAQRHGTVVPLVQASAVPTPAAGVGNPFKHPPMMPSQGSQRIPVLMTMAEFNHAKACWDACATTNQIKP